MLSYLKGLFKRLSVPKKESSFKSKESDYGEYEISFVDSFQINDKYSNIILQLIYNPNHSDMKQAIYLFKLKLCICGFRLLEYPLHNKTIIFISGSDNQYIEYVSQSLNDTMIEDNIISRSMVSLLQKIDILKDKISILLDKEFKYASYITENNILTSTNPVAIQYPNANNIDPEILKMNYMEDFIHILAIGIYIDEDYKIDSTEYLFLYISDLICKLNSDKEYYQDLFEMYKSSILSNFDIPEFKNIFDINFTITTNDESMYEDIDEIIE